MILFSHAMLFVAGVDGIAAVGKRIMMCFGTQPKWYGGLVERMDGDGGRLIVFDDGEIRMLTRTQIQHHLDARPTPLFEAADPDNHIVARSLQENSIALLMSAAPPHRRAVAASRCRKPTACSRYPAIQGCSTRSTPSCRFRRTLSRAVRLGPSSSSRAGHGILNYFT